MRTPTVVLHIPHSSAYIPDDIFEQFLPSRSELQRELSLMTDWYTDELFAFPENLAIPVKFPFSRLVVDPERFLDDAIEPMATKGMGAVYMRTSDHKQLRRPITASEREALISEYYYPHHKELNRAVGEVLSRLERCLLIDAHSFPSAPLLYEDDQRPDRPDICIGTDPYHTPEWLRRIALDAFRAEFKYIAENRPFRGVLVPSDYYRRDDRVQGLMLEVKRSLYIAERTCEKLASFEETKKRIQKAVMEIVEYAGCHAKAHVL